MVLAPIKLGKKALQLDVGMDLEKKTAGSCTSEGAHLQRKPLIETHCFRTRSIYGFTFYDSTVSVIPGVALGVHGCAFQLMKNVYHWELSHIQPGCRH